MNFAEAQEIERQVQAARADNWVLQLVTPQSSEYRQMPKSKPDRRVFGFFPADTLDGAVVYAAGAQAFPNCREVVAVPSPAWAMRGKVKGKQR